MTSSKDGSSVKIDNSNENDDNDNFLKSGNLIGNYVVQKFIAKGAFGAVYELLFWVKNPSLGMNFALKIENRLNAKQQRNLKMEVVVLRQLQLLKSSHFCEIHFCARNDKFCMIVMTLVGKNLNELREICKDQKYSTKCGLHVAIQCLDALQLLHSIGFLHRDIKPSNYCISLENPKNVVMIDFGLCRKFLSSDGKLRHPRWHTEFKGTYRYSSLGAHYRKENSRKDDLESWLYIIVEFLVGTLPWYTETNEPNIAFSKQLARTSNLSDFLSGCPKEMIHILLEIDALNFYDALDYSIIRGLLRKAIGKLKINDGEEVYDWIVVEEVK